MFAGVSCILKTKSNKSKKQVASWDAELWLPPLQLVQSTKPASKPLSKYTQLLQHFSWLQKFFNINPILDKHVNVYPWKMFTCSKIGLNVFSNSSVSGMDSSSPCSLAISHSIKSDSYYKSKNRSCRGSYHFFYKEEGLSIYKEL